MFKTFPRIGGLGDRKTVLEADRIAQHSCRKEAIMSINRTAGALGTILGLGCAASAVLAPAAFAVTEPVGEGGGAAPAAHHLVRTLVASGGLPAWQVTVIAIGSALLAAAATIVALRTRARRRPLSLRTS